MTARPGFDAGRRGYDPPGLVLLLLCVVLGGHSTFAQENHPGRKAHHRAFLWLDRGFECSEELIAALGPLGIAGTNVAGTASAALQIRHGLPYYVDHTAGKGFLYLRDDLWEAVEGDFLADPELAPRPRPLSLRDPEALAAARDRIAQVMESAGAGAILGYSLDDEIGLGRRNRPIDLGFEEPMIAAFREFLVHRYVTPEALAASWESELRPFAELRPIATQEIRRREFLKETSRQNFAPWADYREFLDEELARVVADLAKFVRSNSRVGRVPVGFSGGEAPHPFSGIDWARMLESIDFCEPYDVGGSRELVRSFARPGTVCLRTLFEDERHARANEHELWDYFLRGDDGVILWAASRCFAGPDRLEPSPWMTRLAPVLKAMASETLAGFAAAAAPRPRIALVESMPSNRLHWMLDSRSDGRAWVHRSSSHEKEHSSQNLCREAWQKLLEDLQLDYEHIPSHRLDRRRLGRYDVVILPRTIALSDRASRALEDFARRGTLIADCQTGLFDEHLKAREQPALDELFGLERRNRLINLREEQPVARGEDGPEGLMIAEPGLATRRGAGAMMRFGSSPAMIVRRQGQRGRTVYLNLLVNGYLEDRLRGGGGALLDELRGIVRMTALRAVLELRAPTGRLPPVRVFLRRGAEADHLALLWNWRQSARAYTRDELAALETTKIEVLFPTAVEVAFVTARAESRAAEDARPRRVSSLEIALDPFAPTILRVKGLPDDVRNR